MKAILNFKLATVDSSRYVVIEKYPIAKGPNPVEQDESYILTDMVKKNLNDICRIIASGMSFPILLQGETSVGKTSLINWLAKASGNTCFRVNNHEHTDLQVNRPKRGFVEILSSFLFVTGICWQLLSKREW